MTEESMTERQPTPEEIAAYEANMKAQKKELQQFYKEELPLLRQQAEYEKLLTQIEGAQFERLQMRVAKARMMAPAPAEPANDEVKEAVAEKTEETKVRTLKREE